METNIVRDSMPDGPIEPKVYTPKYKLLYNLAVLLLFPTPLITAAVIYQLFASSSSDENIGLFMGVLYVGFGGMVLGAILGPLHSRRAMKNGNAFNSLAGYLIPNIFVLLYPAYAIVLSLPSPYSFITTVVLTVLLLTLALLIIRSNKKSKTTESPTSL